MTRFVYVLPAGRFRWEVRWEFDICPGSNGHPPLHYRRKAHALIAARAIAIIIGGEVQPHDRRGRIQDPDSYGPDPRESKG